jgi:branched-chain amino acid transport system ATP-binding protein
MTNKPSYVLEANHITINFGGLTAVNDVSLKVPFQSIISIIGPNGAGKTTFFNCISGFYTSDSGGVLFQDRPINGIPTDEVANLGISRTYQNIRLFTNMSVVENILIGQQPRLRSSCIDTILQTYRNRREEKQSIQKASNLLDFVGLGAYADDVANNLPYGAQRRLEIARALGNNPHLLLLDEPCAGMNPHETSAMIELINTLRSQLKITIVLIEHDMKVVMNISDSILVLDHGERIAQGTPDEIQSDQRVIEAYLGSGTENLVEKYSQRKAANRKLD